MTWQKSRRCFPLPLLFSLFSYMAAVTPGGEGGRENNGGGGELGCRNASLHGPSDFSSPSSSSGGSILAYYKTHGRTYGGMRKRKGRELPPLSPCCSPPFYFLCDPSPSSSSLPNRLEVSLTGRKREKGGGNRQYSFS